MKREKLSLKWKNIFSVERKEGYKALRLSSKSLSELYIALDENSNRCLLLFLPKGVNIKLKGIDREKILISFISSKRVVYIKLKDSDYTDLFDDLILSIYSKISLISDFKSASEEFIKIFYKWALFFEDNIEKKLSEEQIQGLYGELFILQEYLKDANSSNVNLILDSWKGPYDAAKDFEFEDKNIEVKTKKESKSTIKVSSEFQLEKEIDKKLELLIVSTELSLIEGKSLYDIALQSFNTAQEKLGDLSIFLNTLRQKGLTLEGLKKYNNYRYLVTKKEIFNAGLYDFPKLSKSNICEEISNVSYRLKVNQLEKFLIESKTY